MKNRNVIIITTLLILMMIIPVLTLEAARENGTVDLVSDILTPGNKDASVSFRLGWFKMMGLRIILRFCDISSELKGALKEVSSMHITIFDELSQNIPLPEQWELVETELLKTGQTLFLRLKNENENVLFFYSHEKGSITSLTGVVRDNEEIILLEINGKLDRFIQSVCFGRKNLVAKKID